MKWRWKSRIQNVIAGLPMSDALYFAIQRSLGGFRRVDPMEWLQSAVGMVDWIESTGAQPEGKQFLEVGTGWMLGVPMALWLCGAAKIATIDVNRYLSWALVAQCNRYMINNRERVVEVFGKHARRPLFDRRFKQLASFSGSLPELLQLMHVEYLAPADARRLPYREHSFDFHISYAVFEHVPGPTISEILREAKRLLVPGGLLIHSIDLSDHNSHHDSSITAVNFLQFTDTEWRRWAGNKFAYHNRLRAHELLDIFGQSGVNVLRQEQTMDQPSLDALRNSFRLDTRFRSVPAEQLAVRALMVLGAFRE